MSVPPGAGGGAQSKGAVRATRTVDSSLNYTLTAQNAPSGFSAPCQESNLTFWGLVQTSAFHPDPFSFAGASGGLTVNVTPCNAATGDSMHALLQVVYGSMRLISTTSGNFKIDSVDDSRALLTVTDNTTGYSSNTEVYVTF
ncbi:MAG: hypothetical protein QOJ39_1114 [Candidatus Eremiobacteraeota bacterium]|nr:hypothetical protein [Candidatus Eremiobacteraeota bacterium]MEA2719250.1 hypothetical protein [Candidatus Eremiobacteraeota bacterium]